MNPSIASDQNQQDRALLDDFQRELVTELRQRLRAPDLSNADLCKFADKCVDFQKQANDREKNVISRERLVAYERRTDASYHIAQGRNDTQLQIARIRAEAAAAKRRPDHPQVDEDDPSAPFGRKKDGTPYTEAEFDQSLNEAVRDIWGLKPINPKSYMPWEMKRAPDGTLIPPDDPDTTPTKARSAPDETENAPHDADTAVVRVGGVSPARPGAGNISRAPPFRHE